jgi:hypothetical protein
MSQLCIAGAVFSFPCCLVLLAVAAGLLAFFFTVTQHAEVCWYKALCRFCN